MDESRSAYGEEERLIRRFGRKTWGKEPLERKRHNGKIILK
jgi:hypothetical protein